MVSDGVAFPLAPMSSLIRVMTFVLFLIPIVFIAIPLWEPRAGLLSFVGILVAVLYAGTWLYMRPSAFVVRSDGIEIVWPLRRRWIPKDQILGAAVVSRTELHHEFGTLLRVGAGGLWGGFGLAWSSKGEHLGLYVSRHADGFVLLRCVGARSQMITPDQPREFVAAVQRIVDA